jgi:hypothetical protein
MNTNTQSQNIIDEDFLNHQEIIILEKINNARQAEEDATNIYNISKEDCELIENKIRILEETLRVTKLKMAEQTEIYQKVSATRIESTKELEVIQIKKKDLVELREMEVIRQKAEEKYQKKIAKLTMKENKLKSRIKIDNDDISVVTTTTLGERRTRTNYDLDATFQSASRIEFKYKEFTGILFKTNGRGSWNKGDWKDEHNIEYKSLRQYWESFIKQNGYTGSVTSIWSKKNIIYVYENDIVWELSSNLHKVVKK